MPWIIGTEHMYHSSSPLTDKRTFRMMRAITLVKLSKGLFGRGYDRVYWLYFRYKMVQLARTIPVLLSM